MTKTPKRIYVTGGPDSGSWNLQKATMQNPPPETEYIHIDQALALVVAEREACANASENSFAPGSEEETTSETIANVIRARTSDDAQAALDRMLHDTKTEWWNKGYKAARKQVRNEAL